MVNYIGVIPDIFQHLKNGKLLGLPWNKKEKKKAHPCFGDEEV